MKEAHTHTHSPIALFLLGIDFCSCSCSYVADLVLILFPAGIPHMSGTFENTHGLKKLY